MLLLFALPSLGCTPTFSRIALGHEALGGSSQSQTEELEERVPCSSARREQASKRRRQAAWTPDERSYLRIRVSRHIPPRAIVGHRLANDSLAPIRC
ncbi:hypothetical protein CA85_27120 [Allorhodopirellula solitaria]|uniref:Uncharacterized protein n=1 Tax=Allorhodopirellula solitaria TaxID=2527987 RepID=A0A5C5XXI6_9BACT|nr:hypothetical protein CA85_27120 [Allorhodopirellula solitaria]